MKENPPSQATVLVVDDDRTLCHLLESWLEQESYRVHVFNDGESCLSALAHTMPDAVCLDLHLPGLSGLETMERIRSHHPMLPVLILTADTQVETIVSAMRLGAFDYLPKPISRTDLSTRLKNAISSFQMSMRLTQLEREVEGKGYPGLVGSSPPMKALYREMDRLTNSDIAVLIQGESGTGKELVARAIHQHSSRRSEPFVPVNCAAIPDTLQESELFGHEKGSFTGATNRRIGKFEQAHRGTLFLDEVAELALPLQAKLLRVLQDKTFIRVGGSKEQASDFRLIAATHRDLAQNVRDGKFREDLYFRVAVFDLEVPALRDRPGDIQQLARRFLSDFGAREDRKAIDLTPEALQVLLSYDWPGNVRELQNAMQRASVIADSALVDVPHLPPRIVQSSSVVLGRHPQVALETTTEDPAPSAGEEEGAESLANDDFAASPATTHATVPATAEPDAPARGPMTLEDIERQAIVTALNRSDGNLSQVCRELGIGRTTLYRKLKKYELR